jgi:hypothetical protein
MQSDDLKSWHKLYHEIIMQCTWQAQSSLKQVNFYMKLHTQHTLHTCENVVISLNMKQQGINFKAFQLVSIVMKMRCKIIQIHSFSIL